MPEHIHLLISEPEQGDPSRVVQAVKQGFARHVLRPWRAKTGTEKSILCGDSARLAEAVLRFQRVERGQAGGEAAYMHRNPVQRGLVREPEQWTWSSYRSYALGEAGAVKINEWGAAVMRQRKDVA